MGTRTTVRVSLGTPKSMRAHDHMAQSKTTFSPDTAMMCSRPLRRKSSTI